MFAAYADMAHQLASKLDTLTTNPDHNLTPIQISAIGDCIESIEQAHLRLIYLSKWAFNKTHGHVPMANRRELTTEEQYVRQVYGLSAVEYGWLAS